MPTVAIGDLTKGQERAMRALLPMDYGWEFFLRQRFTISFASFLLLLLVLSMLTSILLESTYMYTSLSTGRYSCTK